MVKILPAPVEQFRDHGHSSYKCQFHNALRTRRVETGAFAKRNVNVSDIFRLSSLMSLILNICKKQDCLSTREGLCKELPTTSVIN